MNRLQSEPFHTRARAALGNEQQRGALRKAIASIKERQLKVVARMDDWEQLRERARSIKDETLRRLDYYLEEFATKAERAGAKIHWARDAIEACSIICRIAQERDARSVVKSKSMASEEIKLNAALTAAGVEPVETDLGEWIIQLAGETPSHISVPAIHKTKAQVADLFAAKLGIERTDDIAALTNTARNTLRRRFAAADLGISGVNFGIAETGTILILENEGNIRLTTSLPKTHIALMGIEKVIPQLDDLDVMLKLIAPSGAGQRMTTYQSLITGTKKRRCDEGPEEVHIVLFDNGRTQMLAHPVTRQTLACLRCGACLNVCPVYQQIGGHAYGSVYPGPIGAVITPQLIGLSKASHLPFASSLCGACAEVCPVKIDIPELLLHLRAEIAEGSPNSAGADARGEKTPSRWGKERLAFRLWARVMSNRLLYEWSVRVARALQRKLVRDGQIRKPDRTAAGMMPPLMMAWTAQRDLRPVARQTFREQWRDELKKSKGGARHK